MMSESSPTEIVTGGDVKIKNIDDIGDICKVSAKLSKTTSHLEEFVSEQMNDSVQEKKDEASVFG